jgi:hypothetical protein
MNQRNPERVNMAGNISLNKVLAFSGEQCRYGMGVGLGTPKQEGNGIHFRG